MKNIHVYLVLISLFALSSCGKSNVSKHGTSLDSLQMGLIAYYPFDKNTLDSSGNGHNGVVTGATLDTGVNGTLNSAYNFNNVNQYITVADAPALRLTNTDYTINVWIKLTPLNSSQDIILSKRTGTTNDGYCLSITGAANYPDGAGYVAFGPGGPYDNYQGKNQISINQWTMITVIYNSAEKQVKSYINGVYDSESDMNFVSPSSQATIYIGKDNPSYNDPAIYLYGSIDNLRIYNRALPLSLLNTLYYDKK